MKKLLKYLRPFAGAIIVAIMLLFVQAISDLSLPSYMSNIVNIGIQQKGIEDAVPNAKLRYKEKWFGMHGKMKKM